MITIIISAVLQAAILRAAAQATIGDPVDPEESYRYGFKRLGSVILVSLLVGLAVAGGLILLIIPGLIFLVFLSVSVPVLIVENQRGTRGDEPLVEPGERALLARGRRDHRRRDHHGASSEASSARSVGDAWFVRWIFTAIGTILTAPFSALVSVLLYLDLRSRSEALTADTFRAELAAAGSSG